MQRTRDFSWTWADQAAGWPALTAALAAAEDAVLIATYLAQMGDCLHGVFARNMRVLQREVARELRRRGITQAPNLLGPIPITEQW